MATSLDIELGKLDMKFGRTDREKGAIDFFIRYCSPKVIGSNAEGIAVCIHRFQRDRTGTNRLAILEDVYPLSLEGLESARKDGLIAVKDLYDLPANIPIIESDNVPQPFANRNYNAIYRVNLVNVIRLLACQ